MKNSVESLLETDHEALAQLLVQLDIELAKPNISHAFELLDLFWARLAVHIRAENLHLFPALADAPAPLFTGKGSLPTPDEAQNLLLRLRSDHDFFMKELAQMIKAAGEIPPGQGEGLKQAAELRQRLSVIRKRLETHNRLEEELAYVWPALLFEEQAVVSLSDRLRRELENLPPRFTKTTPPA